MPTLVDVEGFEHQVKSVNSTATMNPALWDGVNDLGSRLSFITGRNGLGTALRVDGDGTNSCRVTRNLTTAGTMLVASFYVRWVRTPTTTTLRIFLSSADIIALVGLNTSGQLVASYGSGTSIVTGTGPTITDGA